MAKNENPVKAAIETADVERLFPCINEIEEKRKEEREIKMEEEKNRTLYF